MSEILPNLLPETHKIPEPVLEQQKELLTSFSIEDTTSQKKLKSTQEKIPQVKTTDSKKEKKDELKKIEEILSENMESHFLELNDNPTLQKKFKKKGEEIAKMLLIMINKPKRPFDKMVELIHEWLEILPNKNVHWIAQEALLRARRIDDTKKFKSFGVLIAQAGFLEGILSESPETINTNTDINALFAMLAFIGFAALSIIVFILLLRFIIRLRYKHTLYNNQTILLITVPKEQQLKEKVGDLTIEQIRAQIATMETFFSSVGGLKPQKGISAWLFGRDDHLTFEIVALGGLIYFYASVPDKIRTMIEQQLQAQYSYIQIEEVEDYNIFKPTDIAMGAYLSFEKTSIYPFKNYTTLESDPLNSLLNPLSKLTDIGQAVIQYTIRPAKSGWRKESKKYIKRITEGEKKSGLTHILSETVKLATDDGKEKKPKEPHKTTPLEEQLIKSIDEKASRAGYECNIRIVTSATNEEQATLMLKNIISSFSQYNLYQFGNTFKAEIPKKPKKMIFDFIYRHFQENRKMIVNAQEMASLWHLPLPSTEIPNIKWLTSRKAVPPQNMPENGILLGYNIYRGVRTEVHIKEEDRLRHMYVIGQTGTGKTTILINQIAQDIKMGNGCCYIDPHGDAIDKLLGTVPPERIDDVVFFDPAEIDRPMGLNMLEYDVNKPQQKQMVISELMLVFDKLYDLRSTGGPMFEQYMRNAMLLVMEDIESGSTLMEIPKVLADEEFRSLKLSKCNNPVVVDFWTKEAEKAGGEASLANMVPYITSKLTQFISNDIMRPIIAQQESAFNFRKIMDEKKILLVKLSKGTIGEMNMKLLGMIIVGKLLISALSRGEDTPEEQRLPFYLYIDEFQNFLTDSISTILSEARKYKLSLNIAHQYIGQLEDGGKDSIKKAVFGNVGNKVCFRISTEDAEFMEKEYAPVFSAFDLINIEARTAYIKLLIDNTAARPFNIATYPPPKSDPELADALKELSKLTFGRDRELVEEEIRARAFLTVVKVQTDIRQVLGL